MTRTATPATLPIALIPPAAVFAVVGPTSTDEERAELTSMGAFICEQFGIPVTVATDDQLDVRAFDMVFTVGDVWSDETPAVLYAEALAAGVRTHDTEAPDVPCASCGEGVVGGRVGDECSACAPGVDCAWCLEGVDEEPKAYFERGTWYPLCGGCLEGFRGGYDN
ncbi:hypothetical protein [Streptomyces tubercidicus]|uniref:hypothetical protein n=1 Tax=Streptomyces tubercidicus TaxID=47759 RepID=UPI003795A973